MRRRLKAGQPLPELLDFDTWCAALGVDPGPDFSGLKTLQDQRAAVAASWGAYREWVAARKRFEAAYGWPGGEQARWAGEHTRLIGAPFDPGEV